MNIKKILNLQSSEEKIAEYRTLLKKSIGIQKQIDELATEFAEMSPIAKSISLLSGDEKKDASDRYNDFLSEHTKKVAAIQKESDYICKSMFKLSNDPEIKEAVEDINALYKAKRLYKEKQINKSTYEDILKAKTGQIRYADILLFRGGKLLILQRAGEGGSYSPEWCIPGGHVDPGEDFRTAAARELYEETGIDFPEDLLAEVAVAKGKDFHIHYFMGYLPDETPGAVLVDGQEEIGSAWIDPVTEIDDYDFIFDMKDNIKKILGIEMKPNLAPMVLKAFTEGVINEKVFGDFCKAHKEDIKKAQNKTDFSHKERKDLAEKGEAMPNGKYPIRNKQDLHDAIKLVGASNMPESEVKAWIKKRAKALGLESELPDSWDDKKKDDVEKTMDTDDATILASESLEEKIVPPAGDGIEKSVEGETEGYHLLINFKNLDEADIFKSVVENMIENKSIDATFSANTDEIKKSFGVEIAKAKDPMYTLFAEFANFLEGVKTRAKNVHWGELDNSKHVYLDELEDTLSDYEDKIMEAGQSKFGRFKEGEINGEKVDVNNPVELVQAVIDKAQTFHEAIKDNIDYVGEMSWIEDFLATLKQILYRLQMH